MPPTQARPICKKCGNHVDNTIDGDCIDCYGVIFQKKETGVKYELNFDRLEWYAYILKRAIANREPKTAWDVCVSMVSHFEQVYGQASQELRDAREVDGFEREQATCQERVR